MRYPWNRPVEILVVEDDPSSRSLMRTGLGCSKVEHHISTVSNGQEASDFLHRLGSYAEAPRPDLIFLDLNMPKKDGRGLLTEIKLDPALKRIPVIMLTSSADQEDINSVYDLHANCYLRKPSDFEGLCRQIQLIEEFWFGIVLWPTAPPVLAGDENQAPEKDKC